MLYQFTHNQLILIEQELKRLGLWASVSPSAQAMADPTPFACESMSFEQWLQFIFLPKMRAIIHQRSPLPSDIALTPMAEHRWKYRAQTQSIIDLIKQLDERLSEKK